MSTTPTENKDIKDKFIAASLPVRIISATVYAVLLIGCVLWSQGSFSAFMWVCSAIAMIEFARMQQLSLPVKILLFLLHADIILLTQLWAEGTAFVYYLYALAIIGILLIYIAFFVALFSGRADAVKQIGSFTISVFYISLPFAFGVALPYTIEKWVILGVFILLWSNDSFAYIFGISLGKHKLMERISPKKTLEGFIGGVVCTMIASVVLYFLLGGNTELRMIDWIIIALIVSIIGTIGDLIESMFKRTSGVKDSGRIMPGHGGILDRLDSFIMCIPFIFIYLYFL